jgi:regulator of cell morphogenesis and NO signaling
MTSIDLQETVGGLVARRPSLSRVFEQAGIDYCCGGKKSLEQACREKHVDPQELLRTLQLAATESESPSDFNALTASLTELADHIEQTHHRYLRNELPRLDTLTAKVAEVHGDHDARLKDLRQVFVKMARELSMHMMKEEQILFPLIRQLEGSDAMPAFHFGSIANPIRQMEHEHDDAGDALAQLRALTDGYKPPHDACNTYRALLDALQQLEFDMHVHVHKENSVLFPRALELEATLAGAMG